MCRGLRNEGFVKQRYDQGKLRQDLPADMSAEPALRAGAALGQPQWSRGLQARLVCGQHCLGSPERRGDRLRQGQQPQARLRSQGAGLHRMGRTRLQCSQRSLDNFNGDLFWGPAGQKPAGLPGLRHEVAGKGGARAPHGREGARAGRRAVTAADAAGGRGARAAGRSTATASAPEGGGQGRRSRKLPGTEGDEPDAGPAHTAVAGCRGRWHRGRAASSMTPRRTRCGWKPQSERPERPCHQLGRAPGADAARAHGVVPLAAVRHRVPPRRGPDGVPRGSARNPASAAQARRPPRRQDGP